MCGITGIVSTELNESVVTDRVVEMQTALQQRGPDDKGLISFPSIDARRGDNKTSDTLSKGTTVALAHTRLSIIDLSSAGHQPMTCDDEQYTIVFNGEIYNYQALKTELATQGEHFRSDSDTEVILKLYKQYGAQCLNRLRGMFAFFIWDKTTQTGFAARDPLGIKPFYYTVSENSFAFASELRALAKSGLASTDLSAQGMLSYFASGSFAEPYSILNDIQQLPAGHSLSWKNGRVQLHQYARIEFNSRSMNKTQAIKITREALEDSIQAHLVSDVPIGIFLSGGIDSTALLALASQISEKVINTYSIAFEEDEWNEGDIAKRVAKHFGSNHTQWVVTREIAQSLLNDFIDAIDQPTIDGFNTYCVSKLAHDNGEKVVLSGLGGDELFAGYKSFQLLPKMRHWSQRARPLCGFYKLISKRLSRVLPARIQRVLDFLIEPGSLQAAHQSLRGIFSKQETLALLKHNNLTSAPLAKNVFGSENEQDQISQLELSTYMRNQLLRDSDVMSMAWGLELRVPLVDYKLLQTLAEIPAKLRLQYAKQLLIDSVPEIPEWVVNRPKQGFRFPFDLWFKDLSLKEQWNQSSANQLAPDWVKLKPWYRTWNLVVLNRWMQKHQ